VKHALNYAHGNRCRGFECHDALLAVPASAERICRQVCDEGFCRSRCVETGDRLYMYDRDRDYYHHRRPGVEFHGGGFNVDIGR
jgi:hypothetical protein